MEKSKVYYTDFRAKLGEGLPLKLQRLLRTAGIAGGQALPHRLQHSLSRQPQKCSGTPLLRLGKRLYSHDGGLPHPHR